MSLGTKFHRNQSNSCQDILLKTANVNLMAALEEESDQDQFTSQ